MTTDTPTPPTSPREPNFGLMSFGDHLEDLRKRIFLGIIGVLPIFLIAFGFGRELLSMMIEPARTELLKGGQSATMLQTAPFETFGTVVHISVVVTILIGAPWLLYQLWKFIAPGLYTHERRFVHFLAPLSMVLAVTGILFLFYVILPVVLAFFVGWGNKVSQPSPETMIVPPGIVLSEVTVLEADPIDPTTGQIWVNSTLSQWRVCVENLPEQPPKIMGVGLTTGSSIVQQYKISEYVKTVLNMGMAFGIGFQMPVVVLMLGWIGLVRIEMFKKYRKHIFAGCFVASAILTPADPASMVLLAMPLYMLFEFGLILLKFFPASRVAGSREVMTHDDGP